MHLRITTWIGYPAWSEGFNRYVGLAVVVRSILVLSVPPKYPISEVVGFIKGKSAIEKFDSKILI